MPHGVHKNPGISWHSADPTLKPWIEAEATRRRMTKREVLDEMAAEYRERVEELAPFRDATEAGTANRAITNELREARQEKGSDNG